MASVLTAGQSAVHPRAREGTSPRACLPSPHRPDAVAGDKAHPSRANRNHLRKRHIKPVIPEKRDQPANRKRKGNKDDRPVGHDADLHNERNTVERLIKAWRCIGTRYDKTPGSHLAGLDLRA
ncbi:hypothetical protein [Embleya sp. NBC_00888]|uniref:hypothetical protein n=1 Tax=Embleya sp. NBC_00888 TaxID=2975960 RepID=UPI002F90BD7F